MRGVTWCVIRNRYHGTPTTEHPRLKTEGDNVSFSAILNTLNVMASSVLVILAFALLAYTLTYNFRNTVARFFAFVLAMRHGRLCWRCGPGQGNQCSVSRAVAALPVAGHCLDAGGMLSLLAGVLAATNYRIHRRRWVGVAMIALSGLSALDAIFGRQVAGEVLYAPPLSYLRAGPLFGLFTSSMAWLWSCPWATSGRRASAV